MTTPFIDELSICNVTQETKRKDQINIMFSIGNENYWMPVIAKDGVFIPAALFHMSNMCLYCETARPGSDCSLAAKRDVIFDILIQYPSIRLEWLFIPHAPKV